jgi:hypothetical protein
MQNIYPKSAALGLKFVQAGAAEHPGFDIEEVEKALGADFEV